MVSRCWPAWIAAESAESESQTIREFAQKGGAVVATGATSLYDEWGDPRPDFALADLFGAHAPSSDFGLTQPSQDNSYLRLLPERRGNVWGPKLPDDPTTTQDRHPILHGFDETDIITFGGVLQNTRTDPGATVLMTFVPALGAAQTTQLIINIGPLGEQNDRRHPLGKGIIV